MPFAGDHLERVPAVVDQREFCQFAQLARINPAADLLARLIPLLAGFLQRHLKRHRRCPVGAISRYSPRSS